MNVQVRRYSRRNRRVGGELGRPRSDIFVKVTKTVQLEVVVDVKEQDRQTAGTAQAAQTA